MYGPFKLTYLCINRKINGCFCCNFFNYIRNFFTRNINLIRNRKLCYNLWIFISHPAYNKLLIQRYELFYATLLLAPPYKNISFFRIVLLISLWRIMVPCPKLVINLLRTYEKLLCKGEIYQFSGKRDPSVQTERHTTCYFIIRIEKYF